VHGAIHNALFQRATGTLINIFRREMSFRSGHFGYGLFEIALFRLAAIENSGPIEMNVALNETW
jgi:hypothetical protein